MASGCLSCVNGLKGLVCIFRILHLIRNNIKPPLVSEHLQRDSS
jgi:hypothetical protein